MNIFTYDNYSKFLDLLQLQGKLFRFKDNIDCNGILLRHDVDFDVTKAYTLSEFEAEKEILSTYFLLTTCDYYNVNSSSNRKLIRKMYANGFEIGLHFDCQAYGDIDFEKMTSKVYLEKSILEDIIGDRIVSISLHAPSIYNQFPAFNGFNNAYSKEFFDSENYISDSCMEFRGKDLYQFIQKAQSNLVQILLHPVHFTEDGIRYINIFKDMFHMKVNEFDNYMKMYNKTYKNDIGEKKLLNLFYNGVSNE